MKHLPEFWRTGGVTKVAITKLEYTNSLHGKKALVTGGSSGIGLAIAKKLITCGAEVVITGRNSEKLKAAKNEISSQKIHAYVWDISETTKISEHVENIISLLNGNFDILVNNAGVLINGQDFLTVSEEVWDQTYATNLKGAYFLSQYVANSWIKNTKSGKILNISSQGGFCTASYPYRMTKWDMVGLTKGLGKLLAPRNIIVNGIAPGMIATDMISRNSDNIYSDLQPNKRLGLPEEIGELAYFLLSPACTNIIGQTIICDGGYTLTS
jgi:3-oxoacyl-[acyl-carrier protein] reductase